MAALVDSEMCSRVPIIVILGATGSGKSKLGIEIARRFCGEIISADSMQAYKGLDIITNKVTAEERAQAPHHLLDVVAPPQSFSVVDFSDAALPIIDGLLAKKKLPVIVGGTNYYIESLLWKVLVKAKSPTGDLDAPEESPVSPSIPEGTPATIEESAAAAEGSAGSATASADVSHDEGGAGAPRNARGSEGLVRSASDAADAPAPKRPRLDLAALDALPSPELHRRLQEVDPDMARRLHPNNRRRIIRSLEVFEQFGRQHSDILREQRQSEGGGPLGGPLRYSLSAIFWLQCDQATLDARLDDRVDDMLKRGLVAEMLDFHTRYNAQRIAENKEADYTKGIFQSIGFKEFHEYLLLSEEDRESERGQRLFKAAVEALKTVTRRYARKQVRWVTNRFLRQPARQVPPVYAFDTSDPSKWDELVYKPAVDVVECLMKGEESTMVKPLPVEEPLTNEPTTFHCETCDRIFIGNIQWEAHISSKKHKKVLQQKERAKESENITSKVEQKEVVENSHTESVGNNREKNEAADVQKNLNIS